MSAPPQLPLAIKLIEQASFDAFVTGRNVTLLAWLRQAVDERGSLQGFVAGPAESGKSHLLQATCRHAAELGRTNSYVPLATLGDAVAAFLEDLDAAGVVCIDNVNAVAGDSAAERALFNLCNRVREHHGCLIAAAPVPAAHLEITLPDLKSRLGWGPSFQLRPLDDCGKLEVLQRRAGARGFELPPEAAHYLMLRTPRGLSSLLGLLDRIDRASLAAQRRVTIPFLRDLLVSLDEG